MRRSALAGLLLVGATGCNLIAGLEGLVFSDGGGPGGASGVEQAGGGGSGGGGACEAFTVESCYDGLAWNAGVGACQLGARTCLADGSGFGPCVGSVPPAYEACGASADLNCDGDLACTGKPLSAWTLGSLGVDEATAIAVTPAGEIVVGGSFEGTITIGGLQHESRGQSDVFVAKLDAIGQPIVSATFGTRGADELHAMGVDDAGAVVVGGLYAPMDSTDALDIGQPSLRRSQVAGGGGEAFVAMLTPALEGSWAVGAGGYDRDWVHDLWVDGQGKTTVVARCWSDCRWSKSPELLDDLAVGEDWSVQGFDENGELLFQENFSYTMEGAAHPEFVVARGDDGEVLVGGWIHGTLSFAPPEDPPTLDATGQETVFLARLDSLGSPIEIREVAYAISDGDAGGIHVTDMATGPDGAIYLTGHFSGDGLVALPNTNRPGSGDTDGFLLKLSDLGGAPIASWAVTVGGPGTQTVNSVTVDPEGNVIVSGQFEGQISGLPGAPVSGGGHDLFVAKLEPDSTVLWAQSLGGAGDQLSSRMTALPTGHVAVAGSFFGALSTPQGSFESAGKSDAHVVFLAP